MKKIFIITGDVSGDLHGALLARSLQKQRPDLQIFGVGGEKMAGAGVTLFFNLTKLSLIGFVEVFRHIFLFRRIFYQLVAKIEEVKPDLIVFIDYPSFNLRVAERVKNLSIPLVYYISPQVWAWGKSRIKKIVRLFTKMITILPFEKEIYEKSGLPTEFVGHPLLEVVKSTETKEEVMKYFSLKEKYPLVTILPGSRFCEVGRLLPVMVKLSQLLREEKPEIQFVILAASSLLEKEIERILEKEKNFFKVTREKKYDLIAASDLVLAASGTATIEIGILERPMIILYKVSALAHLFLKRIIKLPDIAMVNIIAKKRIVPEFVQKETRPEIILPVALSLLNKKEKREEMRGQLREVKRALGSPGATARAAKIILETLK